MKGQVARKYVLGAIAAAVVLCITAASGAGIAKLQSSYASTSTIAYVTPFFQLPGGSVTVRDTKDRHTELVFTRDEWDAFVRGVKAGEFDPAM